MRNTITAVAAAAALIITSTPAQARQQDWPMPPSSVILSHVEGTMATGWYVAGTRYGIPVYFNLPRIGIIRNQTCATDTTGACDATWTAYYRTLASFRDAELAAHPKTSKTPARTAPVVTR